MAVQFVLGRSGTGKTSYCVRAIVDALREPSEQTLVFLVPEQATYQAERAILAGEGVPGYHRLHILSFDRLQFLLLGHNTARPALSRIGRQMVVHKILRDNLDKLQIFGSSALMPGFASEMASTITELHRYARSPEEVEELLEHLKTGDDSRLSALKFSDIGLVFRRYAEMLRGKFLDPDAQIADACRAVGRADFIRGARLWVDGFASFTGGEMAMLIEMLRTVDQAYVALCVDPADVAAMGDGLQAATGSGLAERAGLFEPTMRTYHDVLERLNEARIKLDRPRVLDRVRRFKDGSSLAHTEQNIFRPDAPPSKAAGDIRIVAAPSLRLEIQFVARQVLSLVRDKGLRYRDIAVVASDLSQYEQYVRAYFEDYGIPFFIDKRKSLNQHPVVEMVCAALQTVIGGFAHSDIFACLKSDLVPIAGGDVDTLENYCLAFGVDGRDWMSGERWRFKDAGDEDFDEGRINSIRDEAVEPLLELRAALCPDGDPEKKLTAAEFTRIIFSFLDGQQVRQTVGRWIDEAHNAGDPITADEHRQFFDSFVDIFDTLVEVFEAEEMTARDYFGLLTSAFSQMTLAFIPPSLDQVLVGSIERSRHPSLKAILLIGATQKQFPVPMASSGVLSDEDREAAEAVDFHMAPSSVQSLADRQYLAYIAFTRPSRFLYISYPCVDEKGSPIMRSHFVDELQSLFEDVTEEHISDSLLEPADVQNASELSELLCGRLGRDVFLPREGKEEDLAELLRAMQADGEYEAMTHRIVAALGYDNRASLDPGVINELIGKRLRGSATRLGTFASCPYKYFARYVLALKPRREFKLEPLDLGLFYHSILDSLHKRLTSEREDWATVEDDRLLDLLREAVGRLSDEGGFLSQFIRRSAHNAFIIDGACRMLEDCVLGIAQVVRAGSFRPHRSELGFGYAPDAAESLGSFDLPLPGGRVLSMAGKIDRLDLAEIDGRNVALVLDYKRTRSGATFDWSKLYHGLDVQLAIYMLAVQQSGRLAEDIAGALYMPIEATPDSATLAELAQGEPRKFAYKTKGLINGAYCHHLDANASGYSDYYNLYVKKDGDPCGMYARTNVLTPAHFTRLLEWAKDAILDLAADIASGRIEARPYHRGGERACASCDYAGVCHFDWQINEYNLLRSVGKAGLIAELDGK